MTPEEICRKWVKALGLAWHPDTPGNDYRHFDSAMVAEYDADMQDLFALAAETSRDGYEIAVTAMEESDEWKTMVADAISKAPAKRTQDEWRAIDIAHGARL